MQDYEDKTNEAIMILETNAHVLNSLRKFYESLVKSKDFPPGRHCREDVSAFSTQVNEMIYDSRMHIVRAKLLVQIVADRMTLVRLYSSSLSLRRITLPCTNTCVDITTPTKPGNAKDGAINTEYA